jgi:hypothetical protein
MAATSAPSSAPPRAPAPAARRAQFGLFRLRLGPPIALFTISPPALWVLRDLPPLLT